MEQAERAEGPRFSILTDEIHRQGRAKYEYLEANLICLRKKLDDIGHLNCFSELILKTINTVFTFFGRASIQLKTYARIYEQGGFFWPDPSFDFRSTLGGNFINPFEREGLKLTASEEDACVFSSDSLDIKREVQRLEKGLKDYCHIKQVHKNYYFPGMDYTEQVFANLEISFDLERQHFLAAIKNPDARRIYHPFNDLNNNKRISLKKIPPIFAKHLPELPDSAKTFRFFVKATIPSGFVTEHELSWVLQTTEQDPFQLNQGSLPLILEPGTQYQFYNENHQEVGSFKITLNHP